MFTAPIIFILDILVIAVVDQNAVPTIFCCSLNEGEGTTIFTGVSAVVSTINWDSNLFIINKLDLDITPFNIILD